MLKLRRIGLLVGVVGLEWGRVVCVGVSFSVDSVRLVLVRCRKEWWEGVLGCVMGYCV